MKKIKATFLAFVFFALVLCLLGGLSPILGHKESTVILNPFLETAQEHDVLFLGDSQVRAGILPMELYHKYGVTSYNLASSNCRLSMSYWKLMNVLDYMTPKLVMLSVTDVERPELTHDNSVRLHEAYDAFPLTLTKARGIFELTDQDGTDRDGASYDDVRMELLFPLLKYHARWKELTKEDIHPVYNTQKGAQPLVHVSDPTPDTQLADFNERLPEEGYGFAYLRKIIEECQSRDIPIVLYQPPYPINPDVHKGTHTCAAIAEEYGIEMLDFPAMDRVVDYYTDCADPGSHLNFSGAYKLTDFLGRYMTEHYDLPDRRSDAAWAHWNDDWNAYVDEKIRVIAEDADSLRSRLTLLHDESFSVILTVRPGFDYSADNSKGALQNIAREHVFEDDDLVSADLKPLDGLNDAADFNQGYMLIIDRDAGEDYDAIHEFYGISEQEFETSFGYVFCRMDGEWIDLSLTQDDTETYYFDTWEDQDQDIRLIIIDRRTRKPALSMAFSRGEEKAETEEIPL